ncbi:hypothetical protein GAO09_22565 [Rhizobiales bacterium RZME27]|jgi:hypothetical protein|uniref:Uncharacterized protein n=1 Tax=Endobacterium cereale TaxID=2663029 RepID=A0A6A8AJB0_9HYPH|nr:hypothetical protein [Endobacterium cereale]MEB2845551.1 hypothetical protein [Endobacterium cereale]MQY48821.1 hypothetical protein [Endobacterium cereale]
MATIAELKHKLMADPDFRAEYEKADAEFKRIEEAARSNGKKIKLAE